MTPTILQEVVQTVRGLTEEQQKEVLLYAKKIQEEKNGEEITKPKQKIWEKIDEIMQSVPEEAWEGMPTDGSLNHDHYLYGAPKRKE